MLPGPHRKLIKGVSKAAKKTIVPLGNGAVVTTGEWDENADAILELWLGEQAGGAAAADLLFGDAESSGRLAESMPVSLTDLPAQLNFPGEEGVVRCGEGPFVGYRALDETSAPVCYPFGHGLSYTDFEFRDLDVRVKEIEEDTALDDVVVTVCAMVTNVGNRAGRAVPQLYLGRPESNLIRPPRELRDYAAIDLAPGESARVTFEVSKRWVSSWDEKNQRWWVEMGPLVVEVGASSRDLPLVAETDLSGWQPTRALTDDSTIREWVENPEAQREVLEALGEFGVDFAPDTYDPKIAELFGSIPLRNVPVMGMSKTMTLDDLDRLVAKYGTES